MFSVSLACYTREGKALLFRWRFSSSVSILYLVQERLAISKWSFLSSKCVLRFYALKTFFAYILHCATENSNLTFFCFISFHLFFKYLDTNSLQLMFYVQLPRTQHHLNKAHEIMFEKIVSLSCAIWKIETSSQMKKYDNAIYRPHVPSLPSKFGKSSVLDAST